MAMSDCEKCWGTPCECGHGWEGRSTKYLRDMRDVIDRVLKKREWPKIDGDVATLSSGRQVRIVGTRADVWESIRDRSSSERREIEDALDARDAARKGTT